MKRLISRRHFLAFLASAFAFPSCTVVQPKKSNFVCDALDRNLDQEMDAAFRLLAATESPFAVRRAALKAKEKYRTVYIGERFISVTVLIMVGPIKQLKDYQSYADKKSVSRLLTLEDWLSSSRKELIQYTMETKSTVRELLKRDFVIDDDFSICKERDGDCQALAFSRDDFSYYSDLTCLNLRLALASIGRTYKDLRSTDADADDRKEFLRNPAILLDLLSKWEAVVSAVFEESFCSNKNGVIKYAPGDDFEDLLDVLLKEMCDSHSRFWRISEMWKRLVD